MAPITATIASGPWPGATITAAPWCQSGHHGVAVTISKGGATGNPFVVTLDQADAKSFLSPAKLNDSSDC
jgi:hypothetical protein